MPYPYDDMKFPRYLPQSSMPSWYKENYIPQERSSALQQLNTERYRDGISPQVVAKQPTLQDIQAIPITKTGVDQITKPVPDKPSSLAETVAPQNKIPSQYDLSLPGLKEKYADPDYLEDIARLQQNAGTPETPEIVPQSASSSIPEQKNINTQQVQPTNGVFDLSQLTDFTKKNRQSTTLENLLTISKLPTREKQLQALAESQIPGMAFLYPHGSVYGPKTGMVPHRNLWEDESQSEIENIKAKAKTDVADIETAPRITEQQRLKDLNKQTQENLNRQNEIAMRQEEFKAIQDAVETERKNPLATEESIQNVANRTRIRYRQIINPLEEYEDPDSKKRYFKDPKTGSWYDESLKLIKKGGE